MRQRISNWWRRIVPHGVYEQTGVLIWLVSVLLIGLRIVLDVPDLPVFRQIVRLSTAGLYGLGGVLVLVTPVLVALEPWRRWHLRGRMGPQHSGAGRATAQLAVDSFLAASLLHTAIAWAEQDRMPAWLLGQLAILGLAHVALVVWQEAQQRPSARRN